MRYLTVQDLLNLLSNRKNDKITELIVHHWFTLYGKNDSVQEVEQKEPHS